MGALGARLGRWLPRRARSLVYRRMVHCDTSLPGELVFKLAETREELEACFGLLHDAYVASGFMKSDPSGLRVTLYHALPTTSTLLAKHGDRVVGTVSLIRESALGFPLQRIFDLQEVRRQGGRIAEVSALAVDRRFRSSARTVLFPLMKFMYEYASRCFDTRHLVIAVNPRHIGMYESLLLFRRLQPHPVSHYDFVNGAPAVGAHLDLAVAPERYRRQYGRQPGARNLHHYFTSLTLPNIVFPDKRFFTTNDPVMTPELIEHFFKRRTNGFAGLDARELMLLHSIYDLPAYKGCLPPLPAGVDPKVLRRRQHRRFSVRCPAEFRAEGGRCYRMRVVECSMSGFRAHTEATLPPEAIGEVSVLVGENERSRLRVRLLRHSANRARVVVFQVCEADPVWRKFVSALRMAQTHSELGEATRFV